MTRGNSRRKSLKYELVGYRKEGRLAL